MTIIKKVGCTLTFLSSSRPRDKILDASATLLASCKEANTTGGISVASRGGSTPHSSSCHESNKACQLRPP